jgi:hypothetical protein
MNKGVMTQLERDLIRRTHERLDNLVKDTFDLFDMAGLRERDAATTLSSAFLWGFIQSIPDTIPIEEVLEIVAKALKHQRRRHRNAKTRS